MLANRYESDVDLRTWLYVPSGTRWSTIIDTHQVVKIHKKKILLRYNLQYVPYAHFGYWTLISDPLPNKEVSKIEKWYPKITKTS